VVSRAGEWCELRRPGSGETVRSPRHRPPASLSLTVKDTKLAQKLGQLQPFTAVFPQGCTGQIASFRPTQLFSLNPF
jgi:hypothetical protein